MKLILNKSLIKFRKGSSSLGPDIGIMNFSISSTNILNRGMLCNDLVNSKFCKNNKNEYNTIFSGCRTCPNKSIFARVLYSHVYVCLCLNYNPKYDWIIK